MKSFIIFAVPQDVIVTIQENDDDSHIARIWDNIKSQGYRHVWTDCGTEYFDHAFDGTKAYIEVAA